VTVVRDLVGDRLEFAFTDSNGVLAAGGRAEFLRYLSTRERRTHAPVAVHRIGSTEVFGQSLISDGTHFSNFIAVLQFDPCDRLTRYSAALVDGGAGSPPGSPFL
jgi:hypothetical protein